MQCWSHCQRRCLPRYARKKEKPTPLGAITGALDATRSSRVSPTSQASSLLDLLRHTAKDAMCAAAAQQNMQCMPACTNTAVLIVKSGPSLSAKNLNCKKLCGRNGYCASIQQCHNRKTKTVCYRPLEDRNVSPVCCWPTLSVMSPSMQWCSPFQGFNVVLSPTLALCAEMVVHFHCHCGATQIHALWGNTDIAVADHSSLLFGSLYFCLMHAVDTQSSCIDIFCW